MGIDVDEYEIRYNFVWLVCYASLGCTGCLYSTQARQVRWSGLAGPYILTGALYCSKRCTFLVGHTAATANTKVNCTFLTGILYDYTKRNTMDANTHTHTHTVNRKSIYLLLLYTCLWSRTPCHTLDALSMRFTRTTQPFRRSSPPNTLRRRYT